MNQQTVIPIENDEHVQCAKCGRELVPMKVRAVYLKSDFPTTCLACPVCGQLYIPEKLVFTKIAEVERTLEEK